MRAATDTSLPADHENTETEDQTSPTGPPEKSVGDGNDVHEDDGMQQPCEGTTPTESSTGQRLWHASRH